MNRVLLLALLPLHCLFESGTVVEAAEPAPEWRFTDITDQLGQDVLNPPPVERQYAFRETIGSGGGWFDFDGDGDLDLYLVRTGHSPGNLLFENQSGRFVSVTQSAGLGDRGDGMGWCVGDIDGDDQLDVLVTNHGPNRLYQNRGESGFVDVSDAAGLSGVAFSTACAFADIDGDQDEDLVIVNYVDDRIEPLCQLSDQGIRGYCNPLAYPGVADQLWINDGQGRFTNQAIQRGLHGGTDDRGLGLVVSDLDQDGDLDLYVANDGTLNRLYLNNGQGEFEDRSLFSGAGLNHSGQPEAGMGIAIADLTGNGWMDLFVTHYAMETNTLYQNNGGGLFRDITPSTGLGPSSRLTVGWGTVALDLDWDTDVDLIVVNGHVQDQIKRIEPRLDFAQPNQVFIKGGSGRFRELAVPGLAEVTRPGVSRAIAHADINDDGHQELLITHQDQAPRLLANKTSTDRRWIGIALEGPAGNRRAIGARVKLQAVDELGTRQVRERIEGGSFLAQSDPRLVFGVSHQPGPWTLRVIWLDGQESVQTVTEAGRYYQVRHPTAEDP